jgi:uncharacterized protein YyaL (SSP411 family)
MSRPTNHLANETSPYLLQHADNPVDWYPWNEESLKLAREQGKPILLSIGYSACHWCHVMAHESFENEDTAALMNELFINIKVDREERPDLDKLYQTAHAMITQRNGGWPLTMFLSPDDQLPFFGGTYFPDQPRHGLPAFRELLKNVASYFQHRPEEIQQHKHQLSRAFGQIYQGEHQDGELNSAPLDAARMELEQSFDPIDGGLGQAPKFPHVGAMERLLRHWGATKLYSEEDRRAQHMVRFTLERMSEGGVFDQLGGGFCRYSVDGQWMIPHFEKMLYDNGPLLGLLSELAVATGDELFQRTARETGNWITREMQSPEGGYYSALDADSEGEEGKFYAWSRQEVSEALGYEAFPLFAARFGLDRAANFEGLWHLHSYVKFEKLADKYSMPEEEVRQQIDQARKQLFELREQRVHPGRDDKILTSWNALMIKGMLQAARHLGEPDYAESALAALDFINQTLWKDHRLLATYKDGRAHLNAYLDDYAFLIDALLESLQWQWNNQHLAWAQQLAEVLLKHFQSPQGGFYFTSDDHEQLIERPRSFADESMPSGNAIATRALLRLGYLLGETRYLDAAEKSLKAGFNHMQQAPSAHNSLINALEEQLYPAKILLLRGRQDSLKAIKTEYDRGYAPRLLCFIIPDTVEELPSGLADKKTHNELTAYLCEGLSCQPPIFELPEISSLIRDNTIKV